MQKAIMNTSQLSKKKRRNIAVHSSTVLRSKGGKQLHECVRSLCSFPKEKGIEGNGLMKKTRVAHMEWQNAHFETTLILMRRKASKGRGGWRSLGFVPTPHSLASCQEVLLTSIPNT